MKLHQVVIFALAVWLPVLNAPLARAQAPTTQSKKADMSLDVATEDGQKMIKATIKADGKPLENVSVTFGIKRTFGVLSLGEDTTLDDGTAAVKFPVDLPGDVEGNFKVIAEIKAPADYAANRVETILAGGKPLVVDSAPLPRALWAPSAPFVLIVPIAMLLGAVWSAYIFVVSQIVAIRREGARR